MLLERALPRWPWRRRAARCRGRALAEQQRQRVHQHGLAGAGFAGEHVEAGAEVEGDVGDGGEVADAKLGEHARLTSLHPTSSPGQVAPVQLLPHPAEETLVAQPDEANPVIGAAHVHALAGRERLPVWPSKETRRSSAQPAIGSITMR